MTQNNESTPRKPLRLWPGVAAAVVMLVARIGLPLVIADGVIYGMLGAMAASAVILIWWLLFSRAPWLERISALILMIVALPATRLVVHESIRGGHMGMTIVVYGIPILCLALVAWAVASRRLAGGPRRVAMVAAIALGCGLMTLVRSEGIDGIGNSEFHWRWTPTPEERLLAQAASEPKPVPPSTAPAEIHKAPVAAADKPAVPDSPAVGKVETPPAAAPEVRNPAAIDRTVARIEWPGFRGPKRDGVVRGVHIQTNWSATPPTQLWRKPIGPAWSSFAVHGDRIYTQEQRGGDEVVSCYRLSTGEPVWRHTDAARFYESNGGAGPRGTPTLHNGRVYALGATGILNALDAANGAEVWSRNALTETGVTIPDWGIASSPLVIDTIVIVAVSGQLIAYDARTGERRWMGPKGGAGYSSPHLATIDGVPQVLLLRGSRTISVAPTDGSLLWEHTWQPGASIVQPALTQDGDVLINTADAMGGQGFRRLHVSRGSAGWTVQEKWTSRGLKPYFNDFVVHEGHAYGFDGTILASINLETGERKWKGGRYGAGQMLLLPDQDLLLVLSEDGELALVSATPDKFTEVARVPGIEGKTWNHPVLVGDVLLVRNGQEMAAFRLPLADR
jgi:outer membrane protein assembly factor BamB